MPDSLLIRGAAAILTGLPGAAMRHDVARDGADLRIRAGVIEAIGRLAPRDGEPVFDASGCVVQPGWVNTHHHLFQSLLKGVPEGIDLPLLPWLPAVTRPAQLLLSTEGADEDEQAAIAAGEAGDGAAMAMRIVAEAARLMGAPRLIPVASAHIDGALYHGDSGTLFAERLVAGGAKVAVRSTLNVGALDLVGCSRGRLPPHEHEMARRMMRAYEAMGCAPTWTCAPYQAGHRPTVGTDVAWGESNAVVFCNSVLGARTNRYGDFLDIACAVVARAPDYGLHQAANRQATVVVDCTALSPAPRGGVSSCAPPGAGGHGGPTGSWPGLDPGPSAQRRPGSPALLAA
jgi:hypothetical protein